ncbi:MAG TPA: cytochrome o ubiquinol oxidase subunit IV [Candidatus Saccharimonadales bacterium]|nr:cytochrome o ubiquinol oxidase subunit IV [Candidatus Saccharimonadales bacterium]
MTKQLDKNQTAIVGYIVGFVLSVALTLTAYAVVTNKTVMGVTLMMVLGALALVQVVVQLIFFLHLGDEPKPRWKLAVFFSMLVVLVIIVGGSLWIMYHLDYNMMHMPMEQLQQRMDKEAGF